MQSPITSRFVLSTVVAAAVTGVTVGASAEPPECYLGRPAVLAAPHIYGRTYRASETAVVYSDRPSYSGYQRTYTSPSWGYTSAPVVEIVRTPTYRRTVVVDTTPYVPSYDRVYYTGRRVVRLSAGHVCGHHGYYGYRRAGWYRPGHVRVGLGYAGVRHHHRGHRQWGFSLYRGRGHHGRSGGFSFHYGH
ncbi:MAG: hypothetical protein ACE5HE_04230 [Phycisphaerae bacterium]